MVKKLTEEKRQPRVIRGLPALKRAIAEFRARRQTIALVPTMGALHAGHLALVRAAKRRASRVIVSIFVNPTQFAPHEDLKTYPRTFAADLAALAELDVDLVWAPAVTIMYPQGFASRGSCRQAPPRPVSKTPFGRIFRRRGNGRRQVVTYAMRSPNVTAVFGEKDYQQLMVVTQLARDLDLRTRVVGVPIVREADGLALSSRNRYLSPNERAVAPVLHRALAACASAIAAGKPIAATLRRGRAAVARSGFALDYLEARHAETLELVAARKQEPVRLLVAARIGKTRLIDNVAV